MLEFKITHELKPNTKILEIIKDFTYKTKKEKNNGLLSKVIEFTKRVVRKNTVDADLKNLDEMEKGINKGTKIF